eukprot:gene5757-5997_t
MPSPGDVGQPPCFWNTVNPVASEQDLAPAQVPAAQTAAVCAAGGSIGVSPEASGQLLELNTGKPHRQRLLELQMCSRFVPVLDEYSSNVNAAATAADGFASSGMSMWGDDTSCLPATMWFDSTMSSGQMCLESHLQQLAPVDSFSMDPLPGLAVIAETGAAAAARPPPPVTGYNLSEFSGSFVQPRSGSFLMSGQRHLDNGLSTTPSAGGNLHHSSAQLFAAQDDAATGSNVPVMTAAAPGLAMDLGHTLGVQHLLLPPGHQGVSPTAASTQHSGQYRSAAEWAAAAQNKLEQLRQVEELKAALKLEILQLLTE